MGKYSKVERKIWGDGDFRSWGDDGQLAFLFLLTHPAQTAVGAFAHTLPGLAAEKKWTEKRLRKALAPALAKGSVRIDEEAGLIVLPKWLQHNEPESPSVVKAWSSAVAGLPECELLDDLRHELRAYLELRGGGWLKACPAVLQPTGKAAGCGSGLRAAEGAGSYGGSAAACPSGTPLGIPASRAVAGTRTVTSNGGEAAALDVPLVSGEAAEPAAPAAPLGDVEPDGQGQGLHRRGAEDAENGKGGAGGDGNGRATAFSALAPAYRARWDAFAEVLRATPMQLSRRDVGRVIAFAVGFRGGKYAECPTEYAWLILACLVDVGSKNHAARPSDKVKDPVAYALRLLGSGLYTASEAALKLVRPAWSRAEALVDERAAGRLSPEQAAERAELAKAIEAELAAVG